MTLISRAVYGLPSTIDPDASCLAVGDVVIDPAGVELPAIVCGPNGAHVLRTFGGAAPALPVAAAAGEVPVSVGPGSVYAASPAATVVDQALGALYGAVAGEVGVGDGAGAAVPTSAVISAFLATTTQAAARTAIGAGTAVPGPDVIAVTVVAMGPGTGQTFLDAEVRNGLGVLLPGALVLCAWASTVGGGPTLTVGVPVSTSPLGTNLGGVYFARTNAAGLVKWVFNFGSGSVITVSLSTQTTAPGLTDVAPFTAP